MTKRAIEISKYYERLAVLDKESERYEKLYAEFMAFLNITSK